MNWIDSTSRYRHFTPTLRQLSEIGLPGVQRSAQDIAKAYFIIDLSRSNTTMCYLVIHACNFWPKILVDFISFITRTSHNVQEQLVSPLGAINYRSNGRVCYYKLPPCNLVIIFFVLIIINLNSYRQLLFSPMSQALAASEFPIIYIPCAFYWREKKIYCDKCHGCNTIQRSLRRER